MAKKQKGRAMRYAWPAAAMLVAALILLLLGSYLVVQRHTISDTFAVINDTTNQVVWAGSGDLCIPAAPGTRLVSDCSAVGGAAYRCNSTTYAISANQISCASIASNQLAGCGNVTTGALGSNQSYVCASVGSVYGLLFTRNGTASNFTLDDTGPDSATITIRGWCTPCDNSPPSSANYTVTLNQTVSTPCSTGTDLQLIALNGSRALFLETRFNDQVCI